MQHTLLTSGNDHYVTLLDTRALKHGADLPLVGGDSGDGLLGWNDHPKVGWYVEA